MGQIIQTTAESRQLLQQSTKAGLRSQLSVLSAAEIAVAYQPLDSDLTAIAALSTTSYGRDLLTLADSTAFLNAIIAVLCDQQVNQPFTEMITWTATTAPSGTATNRFSWYRVHKKVHFQIKLEYTSAGTTVSQLLFTLPASFPVPAMLTGTSTGKHLAVNAHFATGPATSIGVTNAPARLEYSGTQWQIRAIGAGGAFAWFVLNGEYACQ
jgi:hypothetical protein